MNRRRLLREANTALAVREMQLKGAELGVGRQLAQTARARQSLQASEVRLTHTERELAAVLTDPRIDIDRFVAWRRARTGAERERQTQAQALLGEQAALEALRSAYFDHWALTEAARRVMTDARRAATRAAEERALAAAEDLRPCRGDPR
ncbi:hypothetical protein GCM10017620_31320 [Brevundimonas intermedia]|uniref:Flagellar FliJ protein n=1 Tax=Brevundimonas intermedia TaxID=74315 RepID=A0ABQ5TGR1_9CAUL|nr:hypothetical protein [Brevundimonas intermedia]GLK50158.1 hypothetical protein GCM10017620_31320 [Brevundimonas intermedia]